MDTVRWFKDRAKALLKSIAIDPDAQARVAGVLRTRDNPTLQKVQHVVAVEAGFAGWTGLLHAADVERRLLIAMFEEPLLNDFGIGTYHWDYKNPKEEQQLRILEENRKKLRESVDEVAWTAKWLASNIAPTKTINSRHSSYGLKHLAEKHSPKRYLTNGVLIAGAIVAGYAYKITPGSPNPCFGMSEKSIKSLSPPVTTRMEAPHDTPAARLAEALHDTPAARLAEALHDTPAARLAEALHDTSAARLAEALHDHPTARLAEALHDTSAARLAEALHDTSAARLAEALHDTSAARLAKVLHDTSAARLAEALHDHPAARLAEALHDTSAARLAEVLHDHPAARLAEALHDHPAARLAEALHDHPAARLAEALHDHPVARLYRGPVRRPVGPDEALSPVTRTGDAFGIHPTAQLAESLRTVR